MLSFFWISFSLAVFWGVVSVLLFFVASFTEIKPGKRKPTKARRENGKSTLLPIHRLRLWVAVALVSLPSLDKIFTPTCTTAPDLDIFDVQR